MKDLPARRPGSLAARAELFTPARRFGLSGLARLEHLETFQLADQHEVTSYG